MLDGITLKEGSTYTPAGGSDVIYNRLGETIANGVVLGNTAEANFFAREKVYVTVRMPSLQSDGEYSKMKISMRFVRPQVLASGKTVYNLSRSEIEIHPEAAVGELANLRSMGIAMFHDAETDLTWSVGSTK
jgi:hypothetical protein